MPCCAAAAALCLRLCVTFQSSNTFIRNVTLRQLRFETLRAIGTFLRRRLFREFRGWRSVPERYFGSTSKSVTNG